MKVNNKQNNSWYTPHEIQGEVNDEVSMTAPNQSLSVKEIMQKHVVGIKLPIIKQPRYEQDMSIDDPVIESMIDITEVEEAAQVAKNQAIAVGKENKSRILQEKAKKEAEEISKKTESESGKSAESNEA
jgi:hypothetical protein